MTRSALSPMRPLLYGSWSYSGSTSPPVPAAARATPAQPAAHDPQAPAASESPQPPHPADAPAPWEGIPRISGLRNHLKTRRHQNPPDPQAKHDIVLAHHDPPGGHNPNDRAPRRDASHP
jgi:hypothetical protein